MSDFWNVLREKATVNADAEHVKCISSTTYNVGRTTYHNHWGFPCCFLDTPGEEIVANASAEVPMGYPLLRVDWGLLGEICVKFGCEIVQFVAIYRLVWVIYSI